MTSAKTSETGAVIAAPTGTDPQWREKSAVAVQAMRDARAAREGKPSSFGPVSGYTSNTW